MITENQLKCCLKINEWHKNAKRLTEIQVLTEELTSYKIRYKPLGKKSITVG